jgi:hypothetical protein
VGDLARVTEVETMTSQAVTVAEPASQIERYRRVEQAEWDHDGVNPLEQFVELRERLDDSAGVARRMEAFLR